jgi:hypothetical protein
VTEAAPAWRGAYAAGVISAVAAIMSDLATRAVPVAASTGYLPVRVRGRQRPAAATGGPPTLTG